MLELREGLIQVALGRIAPELIIRNIRLVNVYSGEILNGQMVGIWQGRIAYVGPEIKPGSDTEIIDGNGMYLLPGFIDVHGHADFVSNPLALAEKILPTGTTGMLTDTHDICGALGAKGLELMLKATEAIPFRYFMAAPAACPPIPEFEGNEVFTDVVVKDCLSKPRVLAVSEVTSWNRLMQPEKEFLAKLVYALGQNKRIEGHMAGCSYEKLNALIACGFTSCHESITAEEALNRLRLGLYVILRYGSIRADLEPLAKMIIENPGLDTNRVMLSPDWFSPHDVLKYGYLNHLVAYAVELGISPIKAIQMVTINPAVYLGLDRDIGGIAPGRLADLLLVEQIEKPVPRMVLVGGKKVAADGELLVNIPEFPAVSIEEWRSSRVPKMPVTTSDFEIRTEKTGVIKIPALNMINKTITKILDVSLNVENHLVKISDQQGLLKISMWSEEMNKWMTGILTGFGAQIGGLASSIAHETHSPMVIGCRESDMALAANHMLEIGGGIVLTDHGQIICEVRMATGGVLSTEKIEDVARQWTAINTYLQTAGCPWDDPLFGMGFLGFTGLPYIRITPKGTVDVRNKEIIFS